MKTATTADDPLATAGPMREPAPEGGGSTWDGRPDLEAGGQAPRALPRPPAGTLEPAADTPHPAAHTPTVRSLSDDPDRTGPPPRLSDGPPVPLESAARIGRYTILGELGRGGMGVVYRAWDPHLDRSVALKMLLWGGLARDADRLRFLQEARAVARLDHPGIVRVLDSGVHEGCPYFTMDFVDGPTLRARLEQEGALPPAVAARLLFDLAHAVHHAHERGIIHRDIKPANVLLEGGEHPRISDFGVARLHAEEAAGLTVTGQVLGTPAYMSPEQAAGRSDQTGPWSDVYSLGALLYHTVTGRLPFGGSDPAALSSRERAAPPSPRRIDLRIPGDLDRICQKALAPDIHDRYRSALELAEDVERFLRGEPVQASRPDLRRRLRWQLYTHRHLLLGIGVALAITIIVAAVWNAFTSFRADREASQRETQALQYLERLLKELAPLWREGREEVAQRMLETFLELPEIRDTRAAPRALHSAGRHELDRDRVDQALDYLGRAYVLAKREEEQLEVLLGLSAIFEHTGDRARLTALHTLLRRRLPRALERPQAATHLRALALASRDLAELSHRLPGGERDALAPLLQAFSRREETGRRVTGFWWSPRSRGLMRNIPLPGARTALVPMAPPGAATAPAGLLAEVTAPDGYLFEQPLFDLGRWEGAPLFGVTLIDEAHTKRTAGLYRLEAGRLEPVHPIPLKDILAACTGDLDGDGRVEYYFSTDRRLYALLPGEGGLRLEVPHLPTNLSNSEIRALFAQDLDGDGRQELVAALDGWRAYDVRVFRWGKEPGKLELVARRKLGPLVDAAPFPLPGGRVGILAVRYEDRPNRRTFPESAPSGVPMGTYLLELVGRELEIRARVPAPFHAATLGGLTVGDFDGDGRSDFAVRVRVPNDDVVTVDGATDGEFTQIALSRPDGSLVHVTLPGISAWGAWNLDADPAAELLVEDEVSRQLWVIGAGPLSMPTLPAPPLSGSDASSPAGATGVWERLEDLLSLGLGRSGVEQLRELAATSDADAAARALTRAGELEEARGHDLDAAALFEAAIARQPAAIEPIRRGIEAWRRLRRHDAERPLIERLIAHPELPDAERRSLEARLEALRALIDRKTVLRTFTTPLDAHWQIDAPHLIQRDARSQALVARTHGDPQSLVRLPFDWKGGRLTLETVLEPRRLEWASIFEIGVRAVDGPASRGRIAFRVEGRGGGLLLFQNVSAVFADAVPKSLWEWPIAGPDDGVRLTVRIEFDPGTGEVVVEANEIQRVFTLAASDLPRPGRYELYLSDITNPWPAHALAEVEIESFILRGATLPPIEAPSPLTGAGRLIAEGRFAEVRPVLEQARGLEPGIADRLRYIADCRQGARAACLEGLERLVGARGWHDPFLKSILQEQLRESPAMVLPTLVRLRGREGLRLFWETWADSGYAHADDRRVLLGTATGLNSLDRSLLEPARTFSDAQIELELLVRLGRAWRLLGQHDQARAALQQASSYGERIAPPPSTDPEKADLADTLARIEIDLALSFAGSGQLGPAVAHLRRGLERSPLPELLADEAAATPELRSLLNEPELRALLRPSSFEIPSGDGR